MDVGGREGEIDHQQIHLDNEDQIRWARNLGRRRFNGECSPDLVTTSHGVGGKVETGMECIREVEHQKVSISVSGVAWGHPLWLRSVITVRLTLTTGPHGDQSYRSNVNNRSMALTHPGVAEHQCFQPAQVDPMKIKVLEI